VFGADRRGALFLIHSDAPPARRGARAPRPARAPAWQSCGQSLYQPEGPEGGSGGLHGAMAGGNVAASAQAMLDRGAAHNGAAGSCWVLRASPLGQHPRLRAEQSRLLRSAVHDAPRVALALSARGSVTAAIQARRPDSPRPGRATAPRGAGCDRARRNCTQLRAGAETALLFRLQARLRAHPLCRAAVPPRRAGPYDPPPSIPRGVLDGDLLVRSGPLRYR